ncbi:MAG TPA: hypothetical protein DGE19_01215 [Coprococcus sp.]|jgi:hypothetical protein|nr:hypothetical protein [Coprococcus sp.]
MIHSKTLADFYHSKEWQKLTYIIRNDRLDDKGQNICEYCHKPIVKAYDCICHHKVYLTEDNFRDVSISLNPDNIMLVHHRCHNVIHDKLASRRAVYLVYGSPLSGKTSYVDSVKSAGDLIIDMDRIWLCVSGCEPYVKPARLNAVVFGMRDYLLDCVKYRTGKWQNAYIVGGYPLISERDRLCRELGAQEIFIDTGKDECLSRLYSDGNRNTELWQKYISDWWEKYSPPPEL